MSDMRLSKKAFLVMLAILVFAVSLASLGGLLSLGGFSAVHSDLPLPQTLEDMAFACLTDVYPVDLNHYNVTLGSCYTFPSTPSDNSTTQAVDYMLNSPDSNLVANFMFRDARLYSLNLGVINGSFFTTRSDANLTEAAKNFLVKYQAFSGVDSSELIRVLGNFDEAKGSTVTLGNIRFSVSHFVIPNVANATTFKWIYAMNSTDSVSVALGYSDYNGNKGVFDSFYDGRQF
jgi:hypothetical protein